MAEHVTAIVRQLLNLLSLMLGTETLGENRLLADSFKAITRQ
jgi:hypothetical protein